MNLKVGDVVSVDYKSNNGAHWKWIGLITWTCGYKFEFLIDGKFDVWKLPDLELMGAEVLN